jgi:hypothetical protein
LVYRVIITDDAYDEEAKYKFISDNVIELQGKRDITVSEWKLKRIGAKLERCYT